MPISVVGEDGSETTVDKSARQTARQSGGHSGGASGGQAADDAPAHPVQPKWMTDAADEPPKADEAEEAEAAKAAEPEVAPATAEAAYGGPITAPNVTLPENATLPEMPMTTPPDGAAPSKELAVQNQVRVRVRVRVDPNPSP